MLDVLSIPKSDKNQLVLFDTVDQTQPLAIARRSDQVSMQDLEQYALRAHKRGVFNHPDIHQNLQQGLAVVLARTFLSSLRNVMKASP